VLSSSLRVFFRALGERRREYLLGAAALLVVNACDVSLPLVLKWAIDDIVIHRGAVPLVLVAGAYLGVVLVLGTFRYYWRKGFIGASHRIGASLRQRLFEHCQRLGAGYYASRRTGDLMSRATNDLEAVRQLASQGAVFTLDTALYFMTIPPLMVWLSPRLSIYTLLPLPLIPLFVYRMGRLIHERFRKVQDGFGEMSACVEENMAGIRVVKGFANERRQVERFETLSRRYVDDNLALARAHDLFQPAISLVMAVCVGVVILAGGRAAIRGEISLGDFVAFQHYLLKMSWPMTAVGMTVNLYQRGLASLGRIQEVLETVPEVRDGPSTVADARVERGVVRFRGASVRFEGVGPGTAPALDGIDLAVEAGRAVAIVGPVGAGKSTLLALVPRILEPTAGAVEVDGLDVRRYPLAELRRAIAAVPQETFLFSDTVHENVAFGVPGATREEVREACAKARVLEEVEALPGGFEARLGERGVNLSGGQRQRLAIARALLRRPKVLLLDDCLSSVDVETEAAILERLRAEMHGRTCLVVSHRLTTVKDLDEIVVVDQGRVVERGRHEDLLARDGLYADLYRKQQLELELERV